MPIFNEKLVQRCVHDLGVIRYDTAWEMILYLEDILIFHCFSRGDLSNFKD